MLLQWPSTIKKSNSKCWSSTNRTSSSSHLILTCSHHYIPDILLSWRYATFTHLLNSHVYCKNILDWPRCICGSV
jgi:hypothetical protein